MQLCHAGPLAAMLVLAATAPALSAPRPVLDYRKAIPDAPPTVSPDTRGTLAKAVSATQARDIVVLGHARGSFSAAAGREDIYLVGETAPAAADRSAQGRGQILVVLGSSGPSIYKLPADMRYQRIAGVLDSDRDGRGEVLLETGFYNMGQSVTSVDLVGLAADGATTLRQSLKEVAYDGCDNPAGKKERRASTVILGDDGKLVAKAHSLRCGRNGIR